MYTLILVVFPAILAVGYALYRAALPKPIPGIAYNKDAARRIMGDVPEAMEHMVIQIHDSYNQPQQLSLTVYGAETYLRDDRFPPQASRQDE